MALRYFGPALLLLSLAGQAEAAACKASHASYRLDGDTSHRLSLYKVAEHPAQSDLNATFSASSGDMTFEFTASNGYSFNYLVDTKSQNEDGDSVEVFFFDSQLKPLDIPSSDSPAPAYIFAPRVGSLLWYGPNGGGREFMPIGMWRLHSCE